MLNLSKYWESSSQLTFIFFRGVAQPPTRKRLNVVKAITNHPPNHHKLYKPFPNGWFIIVLTDFKFWMDCV